MNRHLQAVSARMLFIVVAGMLFVENGHGSSPKWDENRLKSRAEVVATVQIVNSKSLKNASGRTCAAKYTAKVHSFEKGGSRQEIVAFAMGPDYGAGERFRVFLQHLAKESDFADRSEPNRLGERLQIAPNVIEFLRCPGVLPGWVAIAIDRVE